MKLISIGSKLEDHCFWQILLVASGREFLEFGEEFIASLELNSPNTRLVCRIYDNDPAALKKLELIGEQLIGVQLYRLETDIAHTQAPASLPYQTARELLDKTNLPVLLVNCHSLVRRDLTLAPAEFQSVDCALSLSLDDDRDNPVNPPDTIWLAANKRVLAFLSKLVEQLDTSRDEVDSGRAILLKELSRQRLKLKVADLPKRYNAPASDEGALICAGLATNPQDTRIVASYRDLVRKRFSQKPEAIILFPAQDISTKDKKADQSFKQRCDRLTRKGQMAWRHMARLLMLDEWSKGRAARIATVPQWQIDANLLKRFDFAERLYVPHRVRAQTPHPKAVYYMQELIPCLFTCDRDGWGGSSTLYGNTDFLTSPIDPRLEDFIATIKDQKVTKAPQKPASSALPTGYDLLVPLQVPGDDALILHSDIRQEEFVDRLAKFAEAENLVVAFRQHPFDKSGLVEKLKQKYSSARVKFLPRTGHIHDYIKQARAVAVINSGVGFEAMFFQKPVITFGKAIYNPAVHIVTDQNPIETVYNQAISEPSEDRASRYARFISHYIYKIGYKLDEPVLNLNPDRGGPSQITTNPIHEDFVTETGFALNGLPRAGTANSILVGNVMEWATARAEKAAKAAKAVETQIRKRAVRPILRNIGVLAQPLDDEIFSGKRIALVGNASALSPTLSGEEIDGHDIVIRMNLGYPLIVRRNMRGAEIPDQYLHGYFLDRRSASQEKLPVLRRDTPESVLRAFTNVGALGRKTDIWSCATVDKTRQHFFAPLFGCMTVTCHPSYEHLSLKFLLEQRVKRLDRAVYKHLVNTYHVEPSSGLLWIEYLRRTNMAALDLYGFDFFSSGHIARNSGSLLQAQNKWPHSPLVERNYVMKLLDTDDRFKLA